MNQAKHYSVREIKAAIATDTGAFTAIAAAYSVDRVGDRIVPGAFKSTIERWQASEKQIPLHWDHSGDPHDIIGTVEPKAMKETEDGLYVEGQLDLEESAIAREAWRLMKSGAMSLSFGYLVEEHATSDGGINELKSVDLFEISITPAPANGDTKVLSMKKIETMTAPEIVAELQTLGERVDQLLKAVESGELPAATDEDTPPEGKGAEAETPKASDPDADNFERAWLDAVAPETTTEGDS